MTAIVLSISVVIIVPSNYSNTPYHDFVCGIQVFTIILATTGWFLSLYAKQKGEKSIMVGLVGSLGGIAISIVAATTLYTMVIAFS